MSRKRILIVDDSPLLIAVVQHALGAEGYDVLVATNLDELADLSDGRGMDLILMDVQMPEAFGDDLATVLRDVRGVATPILLFSSLPEADLAERAAAIGVEGYLSKRAGLAQIVARVRELVAPEGR